MKRHRSGFLLVDILLGVAVFAIIIGALTSGLAFSHREVLGSGDRVRAAYVAEQSLEAVRSIRDQDFAALTEGTHGLTIQDGLWTLSGTGSVTEAGYNTAVSLANATDDRIAVTVNVSWNFGANRSGNLELHGEVGNWRQTVTPGDWSTVSEDGSYIDDDTPLFNRAVAAGGYLYVTSETSDGGDGLYVFDITDTSNPTRVASSYALSSPAYDIAVSDGYLFVVVGNSSTEIVIYDLSTPETLSASDIVATINVAGSAKARSIAIDGTTLYVGSVSGGSAVSFASYDISDINSIAALDTYDESENYNSIAVTDGYAYIASGKDTAELRIVDVQSPSNLTIPTASGAYNLTDTANALSIQALNGYALLGRASVSVSEEILLFDISPHVLSSSGPWNLEAGANVNGIAMDPAATYGFIASENDSKEFSVVNIATFAAGGAPEIATFDTDTGVGRGVYYSWDLDRSILLTNSAIIILQPGS